jgi:acyl-CoA reductase-like NAD-dependent aldehyde dehydrogenase
MKQYKMWINGKWVDAESGKTYPVFNPATEEEIAQLPLGGKADVEKAVAAAKKAFPGWAKKSQAERCQVMSRIAVAIRENAQELGRLELIDHGFPLKLSNELAFGTSHSFDWVAQAAGSIMTGDFVPTDSNAVAYVKREPVGVVAIITPWNFPLMMITDKLSAVLAVGNTCVIKPPSIDSLSALKLAEILEKLDIPQGVVNVITGPGGSVGEALASHPDISMVAFTGSCEVGKRIMELGSQTVKRVQLELGGKNPVIVLDDANVDMAVGGGVFGQIFNCGQVCGSPGRFYIHEKVYDQFVEKFVAGMKNLIVGNPADEKTQMGPVVSAEHRNRIEGFIKSGIDEGAKLVLGGKRPTKSPLNKGYFVMPTVFTHVQQNMTIAREEIFGPVACIMEPFSSDDEVIAKANDNTFGLRASVYSKDRARVLRFANDLQAGTINANGSMGGELPWGGFKQSGLGKERYKWGIYEFSQLKAVALNID